MEMNSDKFWHVTTAVVLASILVVVGIVRIREDNKRGVIDRCAEDYSREVCEEAWLRYRMRDYPPVVVPMELRR